MEQRLSLITLGVKNLQRSRQFYDALGWKVAEEKDSENIVFYNLQSFALALFPRQELEKDAEAIFNSEKNHPPFSMAYVLGSEKEVDEVLVEVEKIGGKIIKKAEKVFWGGYSGYFADPDNFLWEVAYNPFSPLGPNGEFQTGDKRFKSD